MACRRSATASTVSWQRNPMASSSSRKVATSSAPAAALPTRRVASAGSGSWRQHRIISDEESPPSSPNASVAVLADHGCASVLDASAAGAPVYERMGFVDHGLDHGDGSRRGTCLLGRATDARPSASTDLDEVVAFDAERFGAPRRVLLATLLAQNPGRALVRRVDGCVAGLSRRSTAHAWSGRRRRRRVARRIWSPPEWPCRGTICRGSAFLRRARTSTRFAGLGFETRRRAAAHAPRHRRAARPARARIAAQVSLGEG